MSISFQNISIIALLLLRVTISSIPSSLIIYIIFIDFVPGYGYVAIITATGNIYKDQLSKHVFACPFNQSKIVEYHMLHILFSSLFSW